MKFITRLSLLSLLLLGTFPLAQAGEIANVRVETTNDHVNIFWEALPADDFGDADGYALQFSERQSDVAITKSANLYLSRGETSIALRRNSFGNGSYYYVRVYTYVNDENNRKVLGNGSDLLKWRTDYYNQVESSSTSVNDPVVSSNSGSSSNTVNKDDYFDFGELRVTRFDNFADFAWSSPTLMAKSDYDGFLIKISKNTDLSNPIVEGTLAQDDTKARVKGLTPGTQYYAGAYFYDRVGGGNQTFGSKDIKAFKTLNAIPRDGSTRAARNIVKIEAKFHGKNIIAGETQVAATTTTSTSSTSTSTSTTTTSSSTSDIRTRIAALKRQISSLQSELRTLEAKIGVKSSTSASTRRRTTSTRTSTSGSSKLSKLRALLEARRNNR